MMRHLRAMALGLLTLAAVGAGQARAQDSTAAQQDTSTAEAEERPTGLPSKLQWKFNLDAGIGTFGFNNSLYANAHPDPSGDLSENWLEGFAKPALSASYGLSKGELYGAISAVGERTYAAPPPLVGAEASSYQVEDLYLGWRSGNALKLGENALDFTVGRTQYKIGTGFLLWDGAGDGGSRGGFWTGARKAWEFATVARVKPERHTFEGFYFDRDEAPEIEAGARLFGGNSEYAVNEANTGGGRPRD